MRCRVSLYKPLYQYARENMALVWSSLWLNCWFSLSALQSSVAYGELKQIIGWNCRLRRHAELQIWHGIRALRRT